MDDDGTDSHAVTNKLMIAVVPSRYHSLSETRAGKSLVSAFGEYHVLAVGYLQEMRGWPRLQAVKPSLYRPTEFLRLNIRRLHENAI
jgi:hypothetical protein